MANNPSVLLALENASDAIARLDAMVRSGASGPAIVLRLAAARAIAGSDPADARLLLAAHADPLFDAQLPPTLQAWRTHLADEERRVRSGAPLSMARWTAVSPALASYAERQRLEGIWREGPQGRPALVRALDAAAWFPPDEPAGADASAGLLLCAAGRTGHLVLLPFGLARALEGEGSSAGDRDASAADAMTAWRQGDEEPWLTLGCSTAALRARASTRRLRAILEAWPSQDERVAALGRARGSAQAALAHLRDHLATSMPAFADASGLSRPAAAGALERLESLGLAVEVTGRGRDRVYADAGWLALVAER